MIDKTSLRKLLSENNPYAYEKYWRDNDLTVQNYQEYAVVSENGISVDETLKKVPSANKEELLAYMTILLREDHFCDSLPRRFEEGWPQKIVERLIQFAD